MSAPPLRPARDEDTVLGVRPGAVAEPASIEEAAAVVGETARDGKSLLFVGGGTDLDLGPPPESLDVLLRTVRLDRVVEHAPSDQIAVVEAGVTLARLEQVLAAHGQRLALDPPRPDRATVGGVIAANAFGPRRARYGAARDLLIGVTLVRAEGRIARGGGKVVKNVAGFDLPRLMAGSLGTLALLATATFRLHPLPEDAVTLTVEGLSARRLLDLVARMREAQLEPDSVVAFRTAGGAFELAVRFEGFPRGVAEQRDRFAKLAAPDPGRGGTEALDAAAAAALWARHDALRCAGTVRAKIAALPASLERVERDAFSPLSASLGDAAILWYPTLGLGFAGGVPESPARAAEAIEAARRALAAEGGTVVLQAAPEAVRALTPPWGPPPQALPLLREVKSRLDPGRR
ncbi:MAG: FAD-binding oxidoreductase, partial [Syntrophomonadaceae bacterium]